MRITLGICEDPANRFSLRIDPRLGASFAKRGQRHQMRARAARQRNLVGRAEGLPTPRLPRPFRRPPLVPAAPSLESVAARARPTSDISDFGPADSAPQHGLSLTRPMDLA